MVSHTPFLPLMSSPHRLLSSHCPPMAFGVDQTPYLTETTASLPHLPSSPSSATISSLASPLLHGYSSAIGQRHASMASNQCSNLQRKLDYGNEFFHLTVSNSPPFQSAPITSDDSRRKSVVPIVGYEINTGMLAMPNKSVNVSNNDSFKASLVTEASQDITSKKVAVTKNFPVSSEDSRLKSLITVVSQDMSAKATAVASCKSLIHDDSLKNSLITEASQDINSGTLAMAKKSTSNEEQHTQQQQQVTDMDDRKQKRMLSNRESARRSRLRKQQHLDELRAQVAHLRAENSVMLKRFNIATQQYTQLTSENCVLRSHAIELSCQLDRLRQVALAHQQAGGQSLGLEASFLDPLPVTSSYTTVYSQQQQHF